MKIYLVTGPGFHVGPGATVLLLAEDLADRRHALTDIREHEGCALACTLQVQQFVAGSRLGLAEPPIGQMGSVDVIEKAFDDAAAQRLLEGRVAFGQILTKDRKAARDGAKAAAQLRDREAAEAAAAADKRRWTEEWNAVEMLRRRYNGDLNAFLADKAKERERLAEEEAAQTKASVAAAHAFNTQKRVEKAEREWRADYEASANLKAQFPSVEEYILARRRPFATGGSPANPAA